MKDSLLVTTMNLGHRFGISPFQVLKEDADETIAFINCIIETAPAGPEPEAQAKPLRKKEERIRVTEKTATGGWY